MSKKYHNDSIQSLKGADRVRKRPSVIFGSDDLEGCKHSIFEILSNSIDEAREGYGKEITLIYHRDFSVTVIDNGRGIPVGYNSKEKRQNWELLFTELYAGGKYDNNEGSSYEYSLGLNGLGLCATQYASEFMDVEIVYDQTLFTLHFEKGENVGGLKKKKAPSLKTGTKIHWKPDLEVFTNIEIDPNYFHELIKEQAVVNAGIKFIFVDEINDRISEYYYKEGIRDYIREIDMDSSFTPIYRINDEAVGRDRDDRPEYKVKLDIVFSFNNDIQFIKYFHNSSSLTHGGSPEAALKTAFMYEIDKFIKKYDKYKKNEKMINFQDIEDSLIFISSSFSTMTSYENQTKKSINNQFIKQFMTETIRKNLEIIFTEDPKTCMAVIEQILVNKRARERAEIAKKTIKSKFNVKQDATTRPKKFVDCREKDPSKRELFIVEGDSALGACKQSRDAQFQALMPIRGKILNTLKSDFSKIMKNEIIMDLIQIIGTGIEYTSKKKENKDFDIDKLRYDKIIITTDADVDGYQIRTLLLTMFYTLTPSLLKEGKIYIVESPLYEIINKDKSYFAYTDSEKKDILKKLEGKTTVLRSKGLGENDAEMMWHTTMNPKTRKLIQVDYKHSKEVAEIFDTLLGDDLESRKKIIEEKGSEYRKYADVS